MSKPSKERKVGSGRKPNSFSFTGIKLKDLIAKFRDEETVIPCYAKWAATVGFSNSQPQAANKMNGTIIGQPAEDIASTIVRPDDAPGFKVHDFNEE